MKARNMAHSGSISPTSPGTCLKLSQRWELKLCLTGDSSRRSQQTLQIHLDLLGLTSYTIGASSPPGSGQWKALLHFSPECPRHVNSIQKYFINPKGKLNVVVAHYEGFLKEPL
ncbi:hypothetical protein CHARACLAT_033367 [Characodon lateralis]|uniref:Uncharacterized protein n=1 Tax=Characodon lateralis TaxID=208331 RepID=A0ABU7EYW0_9TELE|nr:hypothetical protein [Characodon lateralis]